MNFEFANCEFTDSVDGVFFGNVRGVRFHHNLLDNVSDDGLFLTASTAYDGTTAGGDVQIYQNLFSRCLTTFAFGVGHGRQRAIAAGKQTGSGVHIFRNVFDFRRPVHYHWPTGPDAEQEITSLGRVAGDHGSPAWEPMWIYHNTIVAGDPPRYDYGTDGLGRAMGHGTQRRVFNNIVCQVLGIPGESLPPATADYQADGNLFWSLGEGPTYPGAFLGKFRRSPEFVASQTAYPPGWTKHDLFADPRFVSLSPDWKQPVDVRLQPNGPAIDSGVELPAAWPDPLRSHDPGKPDRGALPAGAKPWLVGQFARVSTFGKAEQSTNWAATSSWAFPASEPAALQAGKPSLMLQGYPAFDAPLVEFSLRRAGFLVESLERQWLAPREYGKYAVVVIDGSLTRAKIMPDRYSVEDLAHVREFLKAGGTLLLMRDRIDLFASPQGQQFLLELAGTNKRQQGGSYRVLQPTHPWLSHLVADFPRPWLEAKNAVPLSAIQGERLIGSEGTAAVLFRAAVGEGQLLYFGWSLAQSLPSGREKGSVAQEEQFEEQMQILLKLTASLASKK